MFLRCQAWKLRKQFSSSRRPQNVSNSCPKVFSLSHRGADPSLATSGSTYKRVPSLVVSQNSKSRSSCASKILFVYSCNPLITPNLSPAPASGMLLLLNLFRFSAVVRIDWSASDGVNSGTSFDAMVRLSCSPAKGHAENCHGLPWGPCLGIRHWIPPSHGNLELLIESDCFQTIWLNRGKGAQHCCKSPSWPSIILGDSEETWSAILIDAGPTLAAKCGQHAFPNAWQTA